MKNDRPIEVGQVREFKGLANNFYYVINNVTQEGNVSLTVITGACAGEKYFWADIFVYQDVVVM